MASEGGKGKSRVAGSVGASIAHATESDDKKSKALARELLDQHFSIGRPSAAMRLLVYGVQKVGKTTFLAHCPGVIFLPLEEGANQYPVAQWKAPIRSFPDFIDALQKLRYGKHAFRAIAIDTADALDELIKIELESKLRDLAKTQKDAPRTLRELNEEEWGEGWNLLRDLWRQVFVLLDAIRDERGMHVLFAAHEATETVRVLGGEFDYPRHGPALAGKKAATLLKAWCDYVLRFAAEVTISKDRGRLKVTATGERFMHCTQKPTHDAGCRGYATWPDKLLLDKRTGWTDFVGTRDLIDKHGEAIVEVLGGRFAGAAKGLPDERRAAAIEAFNDALGGRNYLLCDRIAAQVVEDVAEIARAGGAAVSAGASNAPTEPPLPAGAPPSETGPTSSANGAMEEGGIS